MGAMRLDSDFHTCRTDTSLTQPSPQPQNVLIISRVFILTMFSLRLIMTSIHITLLVSSQHTATVLYLPKESFKNKHSFKWKSSKQTNEQTKPRLRKIELIRQRNNSNSDPSIKCIILSIAPFIAHFCHFHGLTSDGISPENKVFQNAKISSQIK